MKEYWSAFFNKIGSFFTSNGFNILAVVLILVIGYFVIKLIAKLLLKIIYGSKIDNAVGSFVVGILQFALWVLLFFVCANILGISGNSFLVAFSSVALAVGLALKDSLSNVANGIVIIFTKPFKQGDHVVINGNEGKIKAIKILTTELTTFDNKKIVLPNSAIVTNAVVNYTSNPIRRLDQTFSVSYDSDVQQVKKVLMDTINAYDAVLQTPAPVILFMTHNSSSLDFSVRTWVNTSEYWTCMSQMNERVFEAFRANGIEIPYGQYDIHFRNPIPTDINEKPTLIAPSVKENDNETK